MSVQLGSLISVAIMDLGLWRPGGGAQSSETCWTKFLLQTVGGEVAVYAFTDLLANVFT